jgi:hypothetical protein
VKRPLFSSLLTPHSSLLTPHFLLTWQTSGHAPSLKESVAAVLRGDYYEEKEAGAEVPSWVLLVRPFFS